MTTITDTLHTAHGLVWQARAELEPYWPTPNTQDALLFALTELGEAVDADLRTNGDYARNRDKDLDVLDELADCAMMLLTAMGPKVKLPELWTGDIAYIASMNHAWINYAIEFAGVMQVYPAGAWADYNMTLLLARIATHPGMQLPQRLTARLERIKAKRLPDLGAYWPDMESIPDGVDVFAQYPIAGVE